MDERTTIAELERRLAESEARHSLLIKGWAQAEWETDGEGVVAADGPSWRAYTGQTVEEWLGSGWLDAVHPDDRAHAERQWREAVAAPKASCWVALRRARPCGWNSLMATRHPGTGLRAS